MDDLDLTQYEKLGPFEIKDFLAKVASKAALESSLSYLNAGRGNPNWVATEPREAFFLLGQFAVTESKRVLDLPPGVGGMPKAPGIAGRLETWLEKHDDMPGAPFLQRMVPWTVKKFELRRGQVRARAGGFHHRRPLPGAGPHAGAQRAGRPRVPAVGDVRQPAPEGPVQDLRGRGRHRRDVLHLQVAEEQPDSSTPATRSRSACRSSRHISRWRTSRTTTCISSRCRRSRRTGFSIRTKNSKKLLDPKVKAFFIVNPGNPYAVAISQETIEKIGAVLKKRPDLILLTDDVYGTFVPGFRSLMGAFPKNTIGVYSYSKYFGCTGWRLGTVAVHEDNIFDEMIAKHPEPIKKKLDKRYGGLTLEPRKLAFIDRIVADSRDVALNHTAGLSLPQQVMMTLFSLAELMDEKKDYQKACIGIVKKRVEATIEGLGIEARSERALRLVLRPDRLRVLRPQAPG